MNTTLTIFIGLGAGIFLTSLVISFFRKKQVGGGTEQKILDMMALERENRNRETESLRKQIFQQSEALQRQFDRVNKTVDTKLGESSKQLNERLDKSSHVIGNLQKELGKMGEIGSKIENLDRILRAPKGRGSLGEESLEELLRSVFPENIWERQYSMGQGLVVDAVLKTSNGLIPIDAKYPLEAFERLVNAADEETANTAKKEFQRDVKKRIDEVSKYIQPQKGTLGFALLFIPNENIYYEAQIRDQVIPEYAKARNVLLTGPNTMLYVLQILFHAYQSQQFAKEAQKALSQLAGVQVIAQKLDEDISVTTKHIANANVRIGEASSTNQKLQNQITNVLSLEVQQSLSLDD